MGLLTVFKIITYLFACTVSLLQLKPNSAPGFQKPQHRNFKSYPDPNQNETWDPDPNQNETWDPETNQNETWDPETNQNKTWDLDPN